MAPAQDQHHDPEKNPLAFLDRLLKDRGDVGQTDDRHGLEEALELAEGLKVHGRIDQQDSHRAKQ